MGFAFLIFPVAKGRYCRCARPREIYKNMLAGVSGIDVVLFVISAEDGVMPQTQEHLDILNLLEVQNGIVVLTKKDLVDGDWLKLIQEEIKEKLKGTFLEDAKMIPVSSHTKEGFDALIDAIEEVADLVTAKSIASTGRMPIDRVFLFKAMVPLLLVP